MFADCKARNVSFVMQGLFGTIIETMVKKNYKYFFMIGSKTYECWTNGTALLQKGNIYFISFNNCDLCCYMDNMSSFMRKSAS